MSRITELADEEAETVEAELATEPDPEPEPEPEEEPEPEPEPEAHGPSDTQLKAYERENQRHAKALQRIMGADFEAFVECDDCAGVGFRPPAPPIQLREHPETLQCPDCDGLGQRISGSRVPDHYAIQCETCRGNGYVRRSEQQPPEPIQQPAQMYNFPPQPTAEDPRIAALKAEGFVVIPPPPLQQPS